MARLIVILALMFSPGALGSDSDDEIDGDVAAIGGDSTRVLAVGGLGDVDINDCLASYQIAILFQGVRLNRWCAAEYLDSVGKHEAAAQMRCSIKAVRRIYGDGCIEELMVQQDQVARGPGQNYDQAEDVDPPDYIEQQQEQSEQIEELATDYSTLLEKFDRRERADAAAARRLRRQKDEDNAYLRGLVDELKTLSQPRGDEADELAEDRE